MTERALAVPGYVHRTIGDADVLARDSAIRSVQRALERAGTLHRFAASHPQSRALQGRGTLYVLPDPADADYGAADEAAADDGATGDEATGDGTTDGHWVVRHLTHGGLLAPLTGDLFLRLGTPRPFNELLLSVELERAGIATPTVISAVVYPAGPFYRGDIARRWIPEAVDLAALLFGEARTDAVDRASALRAAGTLVRELHDASVFHPDLNARNILIEATSEEPRALVLDLEKCSLSEPLAPRRREAMLRRLRRSFRKFEAASGNSLTQRELQAFKRGYG